MCCDVNICNCKFNFKNRFVFLKFVRGDYKVNAISFRFSLILSLIGKMEKYKKKKKKKSFL